MHLNNLLLSVAVPAAGRAINVASSAALQVGQKFANFLTDAKTSQRVDQAHPNEGSFGEELATYAEDLREYLADNGIFGSYRIRFQIDAEGEQSAAVSGQSADQVVNLLSKNRTWLGELRKIATLRQLDGSDYSAQQLNIEISDAATSHWAAA